MGGLSREPDVTDTFPSCEQLAHPILDCLRGGEKEWLVNLLYAFNSGKAVHGTGMVPLEGLYIRVWGGGHLYIACILWLSTSLAGVILLFL